MNVKNERVGTIKKRNKPVVCVNLLRQSQIVQLLYSKRTQEYEMEYSSYELLGCKILKSVRNGKDITSYLSMFHLKDVWHFFNDTHKMPLMSDRYNYMARNITSMPEHS